MGKIEPDGQVSNDKGHFFVNENARYGQYLCAMGWKSILVKPFAKYVAGKIRKESRQAVGLQERVFQELISKAKATQFGKEHDFDSIQTPKDFADRVPIRDYEALKPWVARIEDGQSDVLWPGRPAYFAKTSGTTSGTKYIPLTKDSLPNHMNSARNALMCFVAETNDATVFDGKLIFLSGSPELTTHKGIPTGRLSGIVNHHVPKWAKANQLPTYDTNCIEEWETKLDQIVKETLHADMRLISGIPPWVQMYYERIREKTGQPVGEVFPNYKVFVYGGVNYEPYRGQLEAAVGRRIPSIETYPASEGFIAFQDTQTEPGLLLNANSGIFFEFVPLEEFHHDNPTRLTLAEVEVGVNYALLLSNNAGLWAYNIGDTVKFVSKDPYRLEVTGRVKHFISAFGEHVIGEEVEKAMLETTAQHGGEVVEFHVAPQVHPTEGGLPYHEWWVEFSEVPGDLTAFAQSLDQALCRLNSYYDDLIRGNILQRAKLRVLPPGAFRDYMKTQGKLGGQNKVPRLSNDRKVAEGLEKVGS